jgi:hypothetical protein
MHCHDCSNKNVDILVHTTRFWKKNLSRVNLCYLFLKYNLDKNIVHQKGLFLSLVDPLVF